MAEKLADKMKTKLIESGAMEKLEQKKQQYKKKIIASAQMLDEAMKDEDQKVEEQLEQTEGMARRGSADSTAKGKSKNKNPWIEQWDDTSSKPFYYNKKTGISTWDKPADFDSYD